MSCRVRRDAPPHAQAVAAVGSRSPVSSPVRRHPPLTRSSSTGRSSWPWGRCRWPRCHTGTCGTSSSSSMCRSPQSSPTGAEGSLGRQGCSWRWCVVAAAACAAVLKAALQAQMDPSLGRRGCSWRWCVFQNLVPPLLRRAGNSQLGLPPQARDSDLSRRTCWQASRPARGVAGATCPTAFAGRLQQAL